MATNELQAKITADISDLQKKLARAKQLNEDYQRSIEGVGRDIAENISITKQYEKAIEQLNKEQRDGTIGSKDYQRQLGRLQRDLQETEVETKDLTRELARLKREQRAVTSAYPQLTKNTNKNTKATGNASAGAVEFGRLLGDLPYGIQGVANNIQQLAFVMGGSAGIQIVIALVTGALVAFGDELFKSAEASDEAKKELEELRKTLEDYKDSLRGVSAARLEGQRDAVKELTTLELLKKQLDDTSLSQEDREAAYRELQKLYPAYFGNIKEEQALAGALETQYENLTTALLEKAQAQAAADLITENKREQLTIEGKLLELDQKIAKQDAIRTKALERQKTEISNARFLANQAKNAEQETGKLQEQRNKLVERNTSLLEDNLRLVKEVKEQGGIVPLTFTVDPAGGGKTDPEAKLKITALDTSGLDMSEMDKLAEQAAYIFSKQFGAKIKASDLSGDISITGELLTDPSQLPTAGIDGYVEKMQQAQKAAEIAGEGIGAGFNAATKSIVQDLETGSAVFDAFISSVAGGLVDLLSQFVQFQVQKSILAKKDIAIDQTKATSNAIVAGSETAAASGPFAAFVLPALIGAAIAVIAGAFGGLKFASGGIVPGGSFQGDQVPAFLNSGEMVMNGKQQSRLFNILDGNLGSLQNNNSGVLVGTLRAEGTEIVAVVKRAQDRNQRLGGSRTL